MKLSNRKALGVAILAGSALLPGLVYASTAANTSITNTVTVNYTDANSVAQTPVTAGVSITVNLVASAPTLTSPAAIATSENTPVNLVYTITSTANGPDTYNFGSTDTRADMDADATFTTPTILLGATTLAAAANNGDNFIVVPYDNDAGNNASVNGITAGDAIVIGGAAYVVGTVDKATTLTNNTVQIPLTTAIAGGSVVIGSIVGEQATVTVVATTDSISGVLTSGTHTVSSTATSAANGGISTTQTTATVITVSRPLLTVTKYVRNVTNATFNTGAADINDGTNGFYLSGVSGNPGDIMEYLVVIDNTATGASEASSVVVSDPIPQFTTLDGTSVALDTGAGTLSIIGSTVDTGAAEYDASSRTLYVYAGAGGDATPAGAAIGTGGTLPGGEISRVRFSVTID